MYYHYGFGPIVGLGVFGILISVLIWLFVIWIIVAILRRIFWGPSHWHHHHDWREWRHGMRHHSAISLLDERYAKGEINKEEYEQKKKDILAK
ncbi:MAG TPA: SHOCT domain-containing protein [Candidatus Paceibacterota bacterium]|nr:SHOCT domain-containing protein [Candidatus Paceibacterota bacterium]